MSFSIFFKTIKDQLQIITLPFLLTCMAFIAFQVLVMTLTHNPHFIFDEANTLLISEQSLKNIYTILSFEQNFPAYYLLTTLLLSIFHSDLAVVLFNYLLWIFSIFLFYKVIASYSLNRNWASYFTLLYMMIPLFIFYAYNVRMYELMNVFALSCLWNVNLYIKTRQFRYIVLGNILLIALACLHPSAIFLLAIFFVSNFFFVKRVRDLLLAQFFLCFAFSAFLLNLLIKHNLFNIYAGSGIDYLKETHISKLTYLGSVIFYNSNLFAFLFSFLSYGLIFYFLLSRRKVMLKYYVIPFFTLLLFFILQFFFYTTLAPRHVILIVVPMLILLFLSIYHLSYYFRSLFIAILTLLVVLNFTDFMRLYYLIEGLPVESCSAIHSINTGTVITDPPNVNVIRYCTNTKHLNMIVWSQQGAYNISGKTAEEILILQAKLGGTSTFEEGLCPDMPKDSLGNIKTTTIYLVTNVLSLYQPKKCYLPPLSKYRYITRLSPGIFKFAVK